MIRRMKDYKITETDLKQALIEGKRKAYGYIYQLIKKGRTTGQICMDLDVEMNILNDLDERSQEQKNKELNLE